MSYQKLILILLVCIPLLASKPMARLDRYLNGEASLVKYLHHEMATIWLQYLRQGLLHNGLDADFVDSYLSHIDRVEFPEAEYRRLFREDDDVPASWVFTKKFFYSVEMLVR